MINRFSVTEAAGFDPARNLALESALMDTVKQDELILYLWQNEKTVVIGRNQNLYRECNLKNMLEDGVTAVRRPSGGGAVYHDLGNLNFTFLSYDENDDCSRNTDIMIMALAKAGIHAEKNGRNDMTAAGRKCSGSAYYHHGGKSFHHGTLLVNSDLSMMERCLHPDQKKLSDHSVTSVRSRVMNLNEINTELTVSDLKQLLIESCEEMLQCKAVRMNMPDEEAITAYERKYRSDEWIKGRNPAFDYAVEERFSWGSLRLELRIAKQKIAEAAAYSDCLETEPVEDIACRMNGCYFTKADMIAALQSSNNSPIISDVINMIRKQEIE